MARSTGTTGGSRKRDRGGDAATGTGSAPADDDLHPGADPSSLSPDPVHDTEAAAGAQPGIERPLEGGADPGPDAAERTGSPASGDDPAPDERVLILTAGPDSDAAQAAAPQPEAGDVPPATAVEATTALSDDPGAGPVDPSAPAPAAAPSEPREGPASAESAPATGMAQVPPPHRGGLFGSVLGGLIAAAVGAGAVLYLLPAGWQATSVPEITALERRLAALENRPAPEAAAPLPAPDLTPLETRIAALEAAPAPEPAGEMPDVAALVAPLLARLDALESAVSGLDVGAAPQDLTPLQNRLAAIEGRPEPQPVDLAPLSARIAALESALPDLVTRAVDEAQAAARAALAAEAAEVAEARARAEVLAALGELGLAADTGAPAPAALERIAAATELPGALAPFRDGLPTLGALQAGFPAAARAAIAAAPPDDDAGAGDRLLNFLRSQTGARSLAPRQGDDPDAVLSRAEAAVRQGDLTGALAELQALPPASAAALGDWRSRVELRLAALAALDMLSARLGQD